MNEVIRLAEMWRFCRLYPSSNVKIHFTFLKQFTKKKDIIVNLGTCDMLFSLFCDALCKEWMV